AALPLNEMLRADHLAVLTAELESVLAFRPAEIVDQLVGVLNLRLRCATVGTNAHGQIVKVDIWKRVQSRVLKTFRNGIIFRKPIGWQRKLGGHGRRKGVVFRGRKKVIAERCCGPESR